MSRTFLCFMCAIDPAFKVHFADGTAMDVIVDTAGGPGALVLADARRTPGRSARQPVRKGRHLRWAVSELGAAWRFHGDTRCLPQEEIDHHG
jgi:hypothetical protein